MISDYVNHCPFVSDDDQLQKEKELLVEGNCGVDI
jgi:hypothetical protein